MGGGEGCGLDMVGWCWEVLCCGCGLVDEKEL